MPVSVLSTVAGDQVPVIPLVDVVGNVGAVDPLHIGFIAANDGIMLEETVTVSVVVVAHWPASGVNVYVPVVVLSTVAGDQVPVIPLIDVVGNTGAVDPLHIGAMAVKVGVTLGVTVTVRVVVVAH